MPEAGPLRTETVYLRAAEARRMEAAEEYGALRHAQAMQRLHPEWGVAWEQFGGGHLVFVAPQSPVGRAHGLGFNGNVTAHEIEHIENFYFSRNSDAQVDVSPYADPSLFESLNQRGFQVAEFNQTLARWIAPSERFDAPHPTGFQIRQVRSGEDATWSALLARAFFGDQASQFESLFQPWAAPEQILTLAAFAGNEMIAGASGIIVPEHRMAAFFGAATLPEFRGRGIQRAFMQQRLSIAQQAGCDLAVTLTMPGTTSQRNAERAGFRTAYTKVVVVKRLPKTSSTP
jgi:GNAT superfamily N-acetyltransferase